MSNMIAIKELLEGELRLPKEVTIVEIKNLPKKLQEQLEVEEGDRVISKNLARETSKIIDHELAEILLHFREPQTLINVVRAYAQEQNESATELLESLIEPCVDIIERGFLVSDTEEKKTTPIEENLHFKEYEIIYRVHQTEDTELYLAKDKKNRFVALKIALPENSKMIKEMMKREIAILKDLPENISTKLIDENLEGDYPYIVTEWIEGVSVTTYAKKLRLEKNTTSLLKLISDITKAYYALHQSGWLHQDVHPGNILCSPEGDVKLIDFGLSQKTDYPYQIKAGIYAYFTPESLEINRNINNMASEQYSVASLLYELFTGSSYINFSLRTETMYQQLKDENPRAFNDISIKPFIELETILNKALEKNPEKRFKNLKIMAMEIDKLIEKKESIPINTKKSPIKEKFISKVFDYFSENGELYQKGLPHGPVSTLFYGEAGIAYALYRYSLIADSASHLSLAEKWIKKAFLNTTKEDAFSNPNFEEDNELNIEYSIYNHILGLYGVSAFISYAKGDFLMVNQSIDRMLNILDNNEEKGEDLVLDSLGVALLFIHLLQRDVAKIIDNEKQIRMEQKIEKILSPLLENEKNRIKKSTNLGMAHGVAGHLYVILKWYEYKKESPKESFFQRLNELIEQKIPYGSGHCIPWQTTKQSKFNTMSGWCNGSSGIVMLLCEVVKITKREIYLETIQKFIWHVWEDSASTPNLCCGLAGRAYALAYYSVITEHTLWHRRALYLLERAIKESKKIESEEMPKHSLYKGELGVALSAYEIINSREYSMPFFGSEF